MIGQTISHYRIVEKLGEGGMGIVYIAEDTLLGRRVAIKTLNAGRAAKDPHFRGRFLREARAVSTLSHPHIATIYDYGETTDGQPYIVMELVKGATLGELMLTEKLTIPRALEIIVQVAEALAEAHRQGIVHRDIKPTNVAMDHRGNVKVLDFGLAKQIPTGPVNVSDPERQTLLNTQTQEGVVVGTPMYLSPEQAMGEEVDARADLFSLGALLYECIAGKPPFQGKSQIEICAKVIRDDPPPPSQLNPDVSNELDRITLKALAKKPERRYQSADQMIADLSAENLQSERRGSGQTVTRLISRTHGMQPSGTLATLSDIFKRPRLSIGYVAAAVIVVGVIAYFGWRWTRPTLRQPTAEARRLYDKAVEAMREGAFFRASKVLQQVVEEDDQFALAHARLAECWTELDSSDKAQYELIRAKDLVPDRSILPKIDGLRLQAVTNTVQRDFPKAVEDYEGLVSNVPSTEKAYALVDLGRAYEKNQQLDKAIESHREGTKLNPRYAAAFLRLGVVLGRKQQWDAAYAAYDQAFKQFDADSEIEGMTEVLIQRGILLGQQRKIDEARTQLLQALEKSAALESKDKRIKVFLNLSNIEVNAGDATRAQQYSSQALGLAQANGMENFMAAGLIDLGYAYLSRGSFSEADNHFSQALKLAQLYKGKRNEARALLSLASLRTQQNEPDTVPDLVRRALAFYEPGGYRTETSQAYNILGRAYVETGEYENAQKTFEQQLQVAQQAGDQSQIGFAQEGLGDVALHRQQYPEALRRYDEKYRIGKDLKNQVSVGYAAISRAAILVRLGRSVDARAALAEALQIAENTGKAPLKELLAQTHLVSAELSLSERKVPEAIAEGQKALDLSASDFPSIALHANIILGLAQTITGKAATGRKRCEDAVAQARALRDPLPLSEALLALAEAALNAGDAQAALLAANEAQTRFTAAKQQESEWQAWLIAARASEKAGDKAHARQFAQQASDVLAELKKQWGTDYYNTYVSRLDMIESRKQLDTLLSGTY
jgi:tetratricopeptide (TPR) repeat protein